MTLSNPLETFVAPHDHALEVDIREELFDNRHDDMRKTGLTENAASRPGRRAVLAEADMDTRVLDKRLAKVALHERRQRHLVVDKRSHETEVLVPPPARDEEDLATSDGRIDSDRRWASDSRGRGCRGRHGDRREAKVG